MFTEICYGYDGYCLHSVGTYPIRPPLPATGGGEGVAEVVAVGPPGEQQEEEQVNRVTV